MQRRYSAAKSRILSTTSLSDGVSVHILASLVAGTVATTVCAPADVLKSRMQSSAAIGGHRRVSLRSDIAERS
jgi:solute carrier family 25 (mitochondrial dicarboxylate transporter), member 10